MKQFIRIGLSILFCSVASTCFAGVAQKHTFMHDDIERHYYFYQPKNLPIGAPLVFALHGMGGNAANMRYGLGLNMRADQYGFAVVYPQGIRLPQGSRHWNAGFRFSKVDDFGFLNSLATTLQTKFGYHPKRTFAMGISMGGFMAYSLVCQKHRVFSAIANVIGTMSADDWQGCEPDADVSILHIHGAKDNVVPINGGGFLSSAPSVTKVIAYWAKTLEAQTIVNTNFNSIYSAQRYRNKHTGAEINYFLLNEFGHDWPHRKNSQFSAVDIVAEFFARLANQDKGKITMGKNASVAPYQMHGHLHAYKH